MRRLLRSIDRPSSLSSSVRPILSSSAVAAATCRVASVVSVVPIRSLATPPPPPPPIAASVDPSARVTFERNLKRAQAGLPLEEPLVHEKQIDRTQQVFAHADTALQHVRCYGFDYDYTLATYNQNVLHRIYDEAKKFMVARLGYPEELLKIEFDPNFAIRGLHYDVKTGYLLKLDQFGKIQTGTVYRGHQTVPLSEVIQAYRGTSITKQYSQMYLHQIIDIFCLPEASLLADITDIFLSKARHADFSPRYLYQDVRSALEWVHVSGALHNDIIERPGHYLEDNEQLAPFLQRLRKAGKTVFLLTNSPFKFVNAGMQHLMRNHGMKGADWTQLFDVVMCDARKPNFFDRDARFRQIDTATGTLGFAPVTKFQRGGVYVEGGLQEFTRLTNHTGLDVMYMGDHIFTDLSRPIKTARWRTAAILKEIKTELQVQSTPQFKNNLAKLINIEKLIDYGQQIEESKAQLEVAKLKEDRQIVRRELMRMFNPHFGSTFRTSSHRTMFFFNVGIYADIYTSSINNFMSYPMNYCFYANRSYFPHEEQIDPRKVLDKV